jgi:vacuolar protein sorting-associated protein 3
VPRKRYWGLHPPPKPLEEVIDDGLVRIQQALFLKRSGVDTVVDEDFLSNPPSRADFFGIGNQKYYQVTVHGYISCEPQ